MSTPEPSASRRSGQFPSTAPGRPARGVRATWWYTFSSMAFFALFMAFITASMLLYFHREADGRTWWPVVTAAVLTWVAGLAQVYGTWLVRTGMGAGWPRPWATALLVVPAALVWVLTLWMPGGGLPGGIPLWLAANVLAILVHGVTRRLVFAAGVVLFLGHWWAGAQLTGVVVPAGEAARQVPALVFFVVFVPVVFLFSAWWWNIVVQLDAARRDAAQLAVARERLRFASDLHDIQGHHLQVIALKAELAERLLAAGRPEAAQGNIHEVRTLARTALEETRSLVRDLREVSLEEEMANAQDVLAASGARVRLRGIHVQDPAARTLLGLAVREGATNILRHASSATEVSIVLDAAGGGQRLVMTNDGVEDPGGTGDGTGAAGPASGTGLSGLDRRFQASGGSVTGGRDGGTYVLEARLPALPGGSTVEQGPTPGQEREQSA
ncbi:histidine kinase [Citricoccus sp. I39-566]|uniref:sensor histidine kinase n=1 Tax=Citricoccus sp. I39-566 TaxID=3073268 RepID=UPI00286A035A|nr:histidine kinase [Citricoccus sp. I39-566]WMY78339.1 histidine kinase [Citricoccus sp. I39-566]